MKVVLLSDDVLVQTSLSLSFGDALELVHIKTPGDLDKAAKSAAGVVVDASTRGLEALPSLHGLPAVVFGSPTPKLLAWSDQRPCLLTEHPVSKSQDILRFFELHAA